MNHGSIISDTEALQILKNDLRKLALEKRVTDLNNAAPERKAEIMAEIDQEIDKEIRVRVRRANTDFLFH